ncbi:Uroporphyrinogen-III synthase [Candidatus Protochlamydia naegleriophila]|uniref:Uroporphyrinogen-III synthase n=1 Tax=Candidatus Protochlamydia naegleriophila TaxID=389348 RepID=A0A0U5ETR4_9BACT|nr:uroporphyrinogen-III synthase [Candidatus Protochlamydia naegleriophila]CUI17651.1 Uroporphyrinogen-III synthase [Candidatus Protochlamydia naegleriophila]
MAPLKQVLYTGLDPSHYQGTGQITHCPLIQIIPRPLTDPSLQSAFSAFHSYTHLIITSKTTIPILQAYLQQMGFSLADCQAKTTIAVGKITAFHLRAQNIEPIIAKDETAEGVVAELQELKLEKAFIFWPHSAQARPIIPLFLQEQCIRFLACPLYDTLPLRPPTLPHLDQFEEIVFTSPSTIHAFLDVFGSLPASKLLTPIGPITKKCLHEHLG